MSNKQINKVIAHRYKTELFKFVNWITKPENIVNTILSLIYHILTPRVTSFKRRKRDENHT